MIYLDNNATTKVDESVLQIMLPYFTEKYGNSSSSLHHFGWVANDAIENARSIIANSISCSPQEIIFTSGATESLNMAIGGIFEAYKTKGNHIITAKSEHSAVLDVCKFLETKDARVTYLDVDKNGQIDLNLLEQSINEETILVCLMMVNNETGIYLTTKEIAKIVHQKNSIFCCDVTQAFGKIPINVDDLGIDLMPISGHKFHAPKGIGALYCRRKNPRVTLLPLLHGGKQENGKRSGTQNVPGIIALGAATLIAYEKLDENLSYIQNLRDVFENQLIDLFNERIEIIGENTNRIHTTSNIIFPIKSQLIIQKIKHKIAVSTGSACLSSSNKTSHVLSAMNYSVNEAQSAIRFSFSKYNTLDEVNQTINLLKEIDF